MLPVRDWRYRPTKYGQKAGSQEIGGQDVYGYALQ
jgi:hypothetical protein